MAHPTVLQHSVKKDTCLKMASPKYSNKELIGEVYWATKHSDKELIGQACRARHQSDEEVIAFHLLASVGEEARCL